VESFDEETYRCGPNDTFASLSQRYYQSDNYAQALQMFNRDHPRASEDVRKNRNLAGQAVFIPPREILERQYRSAIPRTSSGSTLTPTNVSPRSEGPKPATRTYVVQGKEETMWEIAKRELGSGERWTEIYYLNPGFKPTLKIPENTRLQLPDDAATTP
jgi:hypothetical protein